MGLLYVPWIPTPLPHPALHGKVLFASRCSSRCQVKVRVAQSCPTLWDPVDYTVHGILQAGIMDWVSFPFPRRSSQPRDQTQVSHVAGGFFTSWATGEPKNTGVGSLSLLQWIVLTQDQNWGLLPCRQIFLPAEPSGKPRLKGGLFNGERSFI